MPFLFFQIALCILNLRLSPSEYGSVYASMWDTGSQPCRCYDKCSAPSAVIAAHTNYVWTSCKKWAATGTEAAVTAPWVVQDDYVYNPGANDVYNPGDAHEGSVTFTFVAWLGGTFKFEAEVDAPSGIIFWVNNLILV